MNAAVSRGLAAVAASGAEAALVLTADLPLARPERHRRRPGAPRRPDQSVVLVPSADGTGTNAMLLRPPEALRPAWAATRSRAIPPRRSGAAWR